MHNSYMAAMSALFVTVFAIMIHSLIKNRKARAASSNAALAGRTGAVQWLWALVPLAILAGVDLALIDFPEQRSVGVANGVEFAGPSDASAALPTSGSRTATEAGRRADGSSPPFPNPSSQ